MENNTTLAAAVKASVLESIKINYKMTYVFQWGYMALGLLLFIFTYKLAELNPQMTDLTKFGTDKSVFIGLGLVAAVTLVIALAYFGPPMYIKVALHGLLEIPLAIGGILFAYNIVFFGMYFGVLDFGMEYLKILTVVVGTLIIIANICLNKYVVMSWIKDLGMIY